MATPWRRNPLPSINTRQWKKFILRGKDYFVRSLTTEDSYEVQLFDIEECSTWEESQYGPSLVTKVKCDNPNIEAPLAKITGTLQQCLEGQQLDTRYELEREGENLVLSLHTSLSGLPFEWRFSLHSLSSACGSIAPALLAMVSEGQRRNEELVKEIKKRDKAILDYRGTYGPPSRKHLETTPFDEKAFLNEMITSKEFEESVVNSVASFAGAGCQQLYRDVEMIRTWKNKPFEEQAAVMEEDGTSGSWANRLPGSLLPPTTSPGKTSPLKKTKPDTSPAKDMELQRREQLTKRLAGGEDKKKAKKKKRLI